MNELRYNQIQSGCVGKGNEHPMKRAISSVAFILAVAFTSCDDEKIAVSTKLQGTWSWQWLCGGVAGCSYASSSDYKTLIITDTQFELHESGKMTMSETFTVTFEAGDDNSKKYEIELSDGATLKILIENNFLTVQDFPGVLSIYKRSR